MFSSSLTPVQRMEHARKAWKKFSGCQTVHDIHNKDIATLKFGTEKVCKVIKTSLNAVLTIQYFLFVQFAATDRRRRTEKQMHTIMNPQSL